MPSQDETTSRIASISNPKRPTFNFTGSNQYPNATDSFQQIAPSFFGDRFNQAIEVGRTEATKA
jgi:hypothetical protein